LNLSAPNSLAFSISQNFSEARTTATARLEKPGVVAEAVDQVGDDMLGLAAPNRWAGQRGGKFLEDGCQPRSFSRLSGSCCSAIQRPSHSTIRNY
jgi:hypothetical protein